MRIVKIIGAGVLLAAGAAAHGEVCRVAIESNDMMQFNTRELAVPADCAEVEVTLHHKGKLPATVMGHDWVLAKEADMPAVVNAGLAAGAARGYLPDKDARIIAATGVVGGGQSVTVKFNTSKLAAGERYAFFCTSPGHSSVMRGKFLFGSGTRVAQAAVPAERQSSSQ